MKIDLDEWIRTIYVVANDPEVRRTPEVSRLKTTMPALRPFGARCANRPFRGPSQGQMGFIGSKLLAERLTDIAILLNHHVVSSTKWPGIPALRNVVRYVDGNHTSQTSHNRQIIRKCPVCSPVSLFN